jgi:hypothetical protein
LKPPACNSSRFRMLSLPFRCTRRIPPVSYRCATRLKLNVQD